MAKFDNIISKEFENLDFVAKKEKNNYISAVPFPNIVFKNFFNKDFLNKILDEFPDLAEISSSQNYNNKNEVKLSNNKYESFNSTTKIFFDFLNSDFFLDFLQKLTSIKERLVADPDLNGGGLHEIKKGGVLKIHTDFNRHPSLDLDRRINVLIYLNKEWKEIYGGNLEFWDKNMKICGKKITPDFNTMAIFSTTDYSNHGHPDPLKCPVTTSRKSIATYYFSKGRSDNEVLNINMKNRTYFKNRMGITNDADVKKESFKNFLRKSPFYNFLKKIEKKYFRKGNTPKNDEGY